MSDYYSAATGTTNMRYMVLKKECIAGNLSIIEYILQPGNPVSLVPYRVWQTQPLTKPLLQKCLFQAFTNWRPEIVRYLIRNTEAELDGTMAWHAANHHMPVEVFEFTLEEGWDINAPELGPMTGLSFVLDSLPLTKWFLDHGANPNLGPHPCHPESTKKPMVTNSGSVLNNAACINPAIAVTIIDLLIQHGARLEDSLPLHLLAQCGPYKDVSQHDPDGDNRPSPASSMTLDHEDIDSDPTPAPSRYRIPVLTHLLDLGYDPNVDDGRIFGAHAVDTALHYAILWNRVDNARFLLDNGADPWAKGRHGRNALEANERERGPNRLKEMADLIRSFM